MADFFTLLRKKIEIEPTADFDRRFWDAFERENHPHDLSHGLKRWIEAWRSHRLAFMSLAATAAALAGIFIQYHGFHHGTQAQMPPQDVAQMEMMMAEAPMLENLDLLTTFDDPTALTEDDWKVLLADT